MWSHYLVILIIVCLSVFIFILFFTRKKILQIEEKHLLLIKERERVKEELKKHRIDALKQLDKDIKQITRKKTLQIEEKQLLLIKERERVKEELKKLRIDTLKQLDTDIKQLKEENEERILKELDDKLKREYLRYNFTAILAQVLYRKVRSEVEIYREKEKALLEKEKQIRNDALVELDLEIKSIRETEHKQLQEKLHDQLELGYLRYNLTSQLIQILHKKIKEELIDLRAKEESIQQKEKALYNYENQIKSKNNKINELNKDFMVLKEKLKVIRKDIDSYEVGFYEQKYNLENSRLYREKLGNIRKRQKDMLHLKSACICNTTWLVGNSKAQGKSMINRNIKLMLRAFNGECDSIIANVTYRNITSMERRIDRIFKAVNELGKKLDCEITYDYYLLKKQELFLVYEYQEKLYQEKEEQRIIKEQMKEEERAQKKFEKALLEAEKEAERYNKALEQARKELVNKSGRQLEELLFKINELEQKLNEAESNKRAISQAQLTKSGYVYIISNIGSFGESVYKIGMTRRLEPLERIQELNGPSVPFKFDIHAMIFSKNAPELEIAMHRKLTERRLNRVNNRKEFFEVTLEEIEEVSRKCGVTDVEFIQVHEAKEYRMSIAEKQEKSKGYDNGNRAT